MKKFTIDFAKKSGIRALHTMAQVALANISVDGVAVGITDINWVAVLSATALAGVISLIKSIIVGLPEIDDWDDDTSLEEE